MELHPPLKLKRLGDTLPGELILDGRGYLAVSLAEEEGNVEIGLIHGADLGWPQIDLAKREDLCASYGNDWFIELKVGPESLPHKGTNYQSHFGTIFVGLDRLSVLFGHSPNHDGPKAGQFSLPTFQRVSFVHEEIPHTSWTIWDSRTSFSEGWEAGKLCTVEGRVPPPK
ncbi:hypothetical protein LJR030_004092 [Rhizobium sp. LjRoot30]|uniref:hypothetical protein n=1 Tax=Rhizobium sp. LjRoot30 TaxID=3342320 RepID=UPI003ECF8395